MEINDPLNKSFNLTFESICPINAATSNAATLPPAPGELVKTPQRSDSKHPAKPKDDFVVADDEEAVAAKRKAVVYRAEAPKKVVVPAKKTLSEVVKKNPRHAQAQLYLLKLAKLNHDANQAQAIETLLSQLDESLLKEAQ